MELLPADELRELRHGYRSALSKIAAKVAAISDQEALRAVNRLETATMNRPTVGQSARYGAVGAGIGAGVGALGHLVEKGAILKGNTPAEKARWVAANALKGGVSGGLIPVVRNALDRKAEASKLRSYLEQHND